MCILGANLASIIILRGPSAVGKTTIAKKLLQKLKEHKKECAFISEDDFRKKLQFKYKALDKIVHINSVGYIKAIISKLLELDTYDIIIIEGLFRYKEMIASYSDFCKSYNQKFFVFQLEAPIDTRLKRNVAENRDHVVDLENEHNVGNEEESPLKSSILIDTRKPIKSSVELIISKILS